MQSRVRGGPFPTTLDCYVHRRALAIDILEGNNPDRSYMGRCGDGDLLDFDEMAARVLHPEPEGE